MVDVIVPMKARPLGHSRGIFVLLIMISLKLFPFDVEFCAACPARMKILHTSDSHFVNMGIHSK